MQARCQRESPGSGEAPPSGPGLALALAAALLALGALLFVPAGRLDWPAGWLYLGLVAVNMAVNLACLRRWNPALIARRLHPGDGTETWDKLWAWLSTPVFLAVYVVAGLDAGRAGGSSPPAGAWLLGLAVFLPGTALLSGSMAINPFFEKTVRIQRERGHRVIDTGPYRFVRHPGYLGFLAWLVSAPLLLGSAWAGLPASLAAAALVVRTALEDRTLRRKLPGYADYARRVRFRLVPGLW